ncbi:MAG TPA: aminotransferase class V-fold PLP-dependent enzyme, partial [Candidatus Fimisoma avicola]|nr:aminotransferase class V-fold PLP-dependent enzyme [Candidatus Fimisoma avicola]
LGNVPIDVKDMGIDMMSMSSHKIYGPKGIGALFIRKGVRIDNYMHGGDQENNRRAGTENLAGIVGFGKAAELAKENFDAHVKHSSQMRDYLKDRILSEIPDTFVNGTMDGRHPGNLNVTFEYIEGESILLLLNQFGISVSTGSACSSKSLEPSHVLAALGVPDEMIHGTVRFTVGDMTTKEDIDYVVDNLKTVVARLREISSVNAKKGW